MSPFRSRPEDPASGAPDREDAPASADVRAPDRTRLMVDALRRLDALFAATVETLDLAIAQLADAEAAIPAGGAGKAAPDLTKPSDSTGATGHAGRPSPRLPERSTDRQTPSAAAPGIAPGLPSPAEHRVLELLPTTLTRREIADELHLSMNTVKSHTRMLYLRLGVTTRTAAVTAARERGLLQRPGGSAS